MQLVKLNKDQIEKIYKSRMVYDFPKDELKPLEMIYKAVDAGFYEGLGLFDNGDIVAYTFIVEYENSYLIDYLAVYPEHRSSGIGSQMLKFIEEYLQSADRIIIEVENPDYAEDSKAKEFQQRRIEFYKKNGCVDTGVRVLCFRAYFMVLVTGKSKWQDGDDIWKYYEGFYKKFMLDEKVYKNIDRLS